MSKFIEGTEMKDLVTRVGRKGFKDKLGMKGRISMIDNKTGLVLAQMTNLVTTVGKAQAAKRWVGVTANPMDYIAIGEGTADPLVGDTALGSEITTGGGARAQASVSTTTNTAKAELTTNFTAPFDVSEIGWFDAASDGNMGARQKFGAWAVVDGDSVTWKWEMAFGS